MTTKKVNKKDLVHAMTEKFAANKSFTSLVPQRFFAYNFIENISLIFCDMFCKDWLLLF